MKDQRHAQRVDRGTAGRRQLSLGRSILVTTLAAIGLLAIVPSLASATVRYTTPTGTGTCVQADPCNLATALAWSGSGDEVRLSADEYTRTSQLVISTPNLTISGPPGRYSPSDFQAFLIFEGAVRNFANILVQANGVTLERMSISGGSGGPPTMISAAGAENLTLNRVRVFDADSAQTVVAQGSTIVNSIIRQSPGGPSSYAAVGITGTIIGSTITSANAIAIVNDDAFHIPPEECGLQVLNTIAIGATRNLLTSNGGSACSPNVSFDYSWIPSSVEFGGGGIEDPGAFVTSGANNLSNSPPALASPFSGDVNLALDSPAIDTGCGGSCGVEDFYGRPRPIGVQNDIGATETILPPTISTVGVDSKTYDRAQLSATINPNGGATTYNFQIRKAGATTWESFAGSTTGEGVTPETVRGNAQPLDPGTSYEVRVTGLNSAGVEATSPAVTTFTTDAAPQPVPAAFVQIRSAKAKVTRRAAQIQARIRTSGAGRVTLRATPAAGGTKTWCRVRKTVAAAGVHTVSCNLGRKGRTRIRKSALGLVLKASFTDGTNNSATTQRRFTIPRKR